MNPQVLVRPETESDDLFDLDVRDLPTETSTDMSKDGKVVTIPCFTFDCSLAC